VILHILHTNDLHSRFERMPQIASCLKEHRRAWEAKGDYVLTVDIGDHSDRMSLPTEATWGHANVEVVNHSGYQYVTIGNNEGITFPKDRLDELFEQAEFTVVLSNLYDAATHEHPHWAVPYAIHEWEGVSAAVLGVTAVFDVYEQLGWEAKEPLPLIAKQVERLRPHVNVVIVLSHLGLQKDRQMAREIEGIDVILGGHTHHLLEQGERFDRTLIAQAGRWGEYVGHVQLVLDEESGRVAASSAEVFAARQFSCDSAVHSVIERQEEKAEQILNEPVGTLSVDFGIDWERETPFASFLAASLRLWANAEVGLANSGLLLAPLSEGAVTRKDLLLCVPHPIKPCAVTLTGEQLFQLIAHSVQPQIVYKELRGFGFRGKMIGWMGVDGITVHYEAGVLPVICGIEVNGDPIDMQREYRIGTVDLFAFSPLFPELSQGKEYRFFLPEVLREVLAVTLRDEALVKSSFVPRWLDCRGKV
jgi:2',3'-cyclic-nucleotide 2'-phosphodiesterase (5'-nucleotidase family)